MPTHQGNMFNEAQAKQLLTYAFSHPDEIFIRIALLAILDTDEPAEKLLTSVISTRIPSRLGSSLEWIVLYGYAELILPLYKHVDDYVRWAVINALSRLNDKRHLPTLIDALTDPYEMIRLRAQLAVDEIKKIDHSSIVQHLNLEPITEFEKLLAKIILGQIQHLDVNVATQMLLHPNRDIRLMSLASFRSLGKVEKDAIFDALLVSEVSISQELVSLLGEFRDPRGVDYIEKYIKDGEQFDEVCAKALIKIANEPAIDLLIFYLCSTVNYNHVFLKIDGPSAEVIIQSFISKVISNKKFDSENYFNALLQIGKPALEPIKRTMNSTANISARYYLEQVNDQLKQWLFHEERNGYFLDTARPQTKSSHESSILGSLPFPASSTVTMVCMDMDIGFSPKYGNTIIPLPITDDVHFSVTAPTVIKSGASFILDVWAHQDNQFKEVLKQAKEWQNGCDTRIRSKGPVQITRGTTLQVSLFIPDFKIENLQDTLCWTGKIGNSTFPVKVPHNVTAGYYLGMVTFFVSGLKIAKLNFDLKVGEEVSEVNTIASNVIRIKSAFASYASEDRKKVLARIQGMLKLLPNLDIFLDVVSLRSGDDWEDQIMKAIKQKDIFYLFWSIAASRSPWVEKEWKTALKTRGLGFIDPVPLDPPGKAPAPPPELYSKQFNDWTLSLKTT